MPDSISGATPASHDTTAINRTRQDFTGVASVWLFGYGSLIYKADFPYLDRRPAILRGWTRRLWQGSHDHRGTPEHPGRVATLVAEPGAACVGMAYQVAPAAFRQIDFREKNGYLRHVMEFELDDGQQVRGVVYIAATGNAAWLGPAEVADVARHVAAARGPSGSNRDYVLKLAAALRELGADDPHIFAIADALRGLRAEA